MAYSFDVNVVHLGENRWEVEITETDCGSTDEAEIPVSSSGSPSALPKEVTLLTRYAKLTSGSASTLNPILGEQTDPANGLGSAETAAAADPILDQSDPPMQMRAADGTALYHRSRPDSGSDNAITTVYRFLAGWD